MMFKRGFKFIIYLHNQLNTIHREFCGHSEFFGRFLADYNHRINGDENLNQKLEEINCHASDLLAINSLLNIIQTLSRPC